MNLNLSYKILDKNKQLSNDDSIRILESIKKSVKQELIIKELLHR
ncbi:hypothetical protein [Clostridium thermobutyricum]|nr:hypothetical protein [Clostridium thermobutyricum]